MRAWYNGCGVRISLNLKDKESVERRGTLECFMDNGTSQGTKLVLHIRKNVPWKAMIEEPGIHVTAKPAHVPPEKRIRHDVHISKQKWEELITKKDPECGGGGYTGTRGSYDRVDITYYPI
jgi:hypothetical protein